MNKITLGAAAVLGAMALPATAMAASLAMTTANVNLRAGPSTGYPVVDVARAGDEILVYGCLSERAWCDVDYDGLRGWMSSNYLAFYQGGRRYVGPQAAYRMQAPVITFSFGTYWDRHYRSRPFYRERSRWENFYRGRRSDSAPVVQPQPPRDGWQGGGPRQEWRGDDRGPNWQRQDGQRGEGRGDDRGPRWQRQGGGQGQWGRGNDRDDDRWTERSGDGWQGAGWRFRRDRD